MSDISDISKIGKLYKCINCGREKTIHSEEFSKSIVPLLKTELSNPLNVKLNHV
jgi:hypothetical protein